MYVYIYIYIGLPQCVFVCACVRACVCVYTLAGAEAERKLDAYRDYLYHLDQAPAPSQPLRGPVPYATVLTCPCRAAQASSALENFVGEVYRGIDCKVSHELYQVGGRPCVVLCSSPTVPHGLHGRP